MAQHYLIDEEMKVMRNVVAPLKTTDEKKAKYVAEMVDQAFLEAYTALCKNEGLEVDLQGADPLEVDADAICELMCERFDEAVIWQALAEVNKYLILGYLNKAGYSAKEIYELAKGYTSMMKDNE